MGFLALDRLGVEPRSVWSYQCRRKSTTLFVNHFDGNVIHTADLTGKVILVNFWASWCNPCEEEAAELEQAWRLYRDSGDVVFLGVDYVDTEAEAKAYLAKFDITYPNGPDLRTQISQLFRIRGVPETYIINREGKLVFVKIGPFASLGEIQQAIEQAK